MADNEDEDLPIMIFSLVSKPVFRRSNVQLVCLGGSVTRKSFLSCNVRSVLPRALSSTAGNHSAGRHVLQHNISSFAVAIRNSQQKLQASRGLATGTRGSRGHGWYVNYRAGKGGRHLQGEYFDRDEDECKQWNDSILEMGHQQVYLDVVIEPRSRSFAEKGDVPPLDSLTGEKHRLLMDLAVTVMPETTQNFIELCTAWQDGYAGSILYRFEKNVGVCGGDVLTNTGKTGKAAQGSPLTYKVQNDPLAMWHVAGTVTMLVPTVGEIDSRFILCTEKSPHLDGINRAFARLTDESVAIVKGWQTSFLTAKGVPSTYDLVIADCGLVDDSSSSSDRTSTQDAA
jgi:cyclophilin family peptidyl-prolyl cis-trans isomerase